MDEHINDTRQSKKHEATEQKHSKVPAKKDKTKSNQSWICGSLETPGQHQHTTLARKENASYLCSCIVFGVRNCWCVMVVFVQSMICENVRLRCYNYCHRIKISLLPVPLRLDTAWLRNFARIFTFSIFFRRKSNRHIVHSKVSKRTTQRVFENGRTVRLDDIWVYEARSSPRPFSVILENWSYRARIWENV